MKAAGSNVLYMAVTGLVYFIIALTLDYVIASPFIRKKFMRTSKTASSAPLDVEDEDSDVAAERLRLQSGTDSERDVLSIRVRHQLMPFSVSHSAILAFDHCPLLASSINTVAWLAYRNVHLLTFGLDFCCPTPFVRIRLWLLLLRRKFAKFIQMASSP
jgi:hypothetical protein